MARGRPASSSPLQHPLLRLSLIPLNNTSDRSSHVLLVQSGPRGGDSRLTEIRRTVAEGNALQKKYKWIMSWWIQPDVSLSSMWAMRSDENPSAPVGSRSGRDRHLQLRCQYPYADLSQFTLGFTPLKGKIGNFCRQGSLYQNNNKRRSLMTS